MKKYPKVKRIGHDSVAGILSGPVTVEEKLDGANFRFTLSENIDGVDDDRIVFGSRNIVWKNEKDTAKQFEHAVEFVRDKVSPARLRDVQTGHGSAVTFFGEAMHKHTIQYDWENTPSVILFDAYSEDHGWYDPETVAGFSDALGIPLVPRLAVNEDFPSVDDLPEPESAFRDGQAEGVVVKRMVDGELLRAKLRTDEFLEQHSGTTPGEKDEARREDDTAELARELWRLEPWAEKQIHKYRDEGRTIEMSVMEDLWRDVFDDIVAEEYETIFLGNYEIDTKDFRSLIASWTADELRAYLNNRA